LAVVPEVRRCARATIEQLAQFIAGDRGRLYQSRIPAIESLSIATLAAITCPSWNEGRDEMQKPLTESLIDRYQLDPKSKEIMRGFARTFPGSMIEWISSDEAQRRKEEQIPAYRDNDESILSTTKSQPKQRAAPAVKTQERLF